jgi:hypothetical protein
MAGPGMNNGVALPIPEADRERIRELAQATARGRAAQMQLTGYVQSMAIEAGISPDCEVRIVKDDVLFVLQELGQNEALRTLPKL